ncbi:alpha/beta hydrolase [Xanthobacter dioxanivorans]|uniref:Alpha/beta hydrolase n=1 Tax=Xanthobacter dioxanivorans TaxID=2528964 RepID=A0A974SJS5_9HYPH|nr:alpha/beta hydrolase [Xanthobacter dioxanivorans]QRG08741.1 alpha/beta hydrolase [Xanthobacter dioxanivorans]
MTLFALPSHPVPDGCVAGEVVAADGVRLRFARWTPDGAAKGTVALFGGRAEFIEKYFEVVRELRSRGFAVAMLDWRGQGGSQRLLRNRLKGHVARFSDYQLDLEAFAREVLLPDCPPPHFALAHSMGGTILLQSVLEGQRWFDRMVLSAPMLDLAVVPLQAIVQPAATLLAHVGFARAYVPGGRGRPLSRLRFEGNPCTSDRRRFERTQELVRANPALDLGAPTIGWLSAAYAAMAELTHPDTISRIRQPLLIIAAGGDRLVSNSAIEHFSARLIAGAHVVVSASRHELMMEKDIFRAQFWAAFDAFVPGTPIL